MPISFLNLQKYPCFIIKIILGVLCGSVADLSDCSSDTARMLSDVDELCARNGVGGIYGQLVTLGYKVWHS